jgi:APA family basic amino acid/polyamine antiporter
VFPQRRDKSDRLKVLKYPIPARVKSLLALLESIGAGLHDEETRGAGTDMTASETGSVAWPGQFPRGGSTVSVLVATAIVVADMVGVGVFTSLGFQVKDIPSGFSILLLWAVGGIVALCGVFSYSELGAMFPRSSGEYNFLGRAYHPAFGFVAGWVSATVGFAAPVALAAMAFGEYGKSVLPGVPPLALAIGIVWLVSIVQLTGVRHSSTFQLISTVLKVVLIVAFLIAGFVIGTPQPVSFTPDISDFAHVTSAPFAIGLVFVMYSFSGWNAATYIIGEMRMPQQNLPRALLTGTLIVLVLYVALNAVFLHTTPIDKLSGQLDVARIAGSYIFGELGGRIVGAMICIGLVSSISAMMWIGPRVMMTMGEDIPSLRVFARKSTSGAPAYAILFQLAVANLMLFTRSFEAVLDFIQFALLFCSFFTVLGVIKLRITQPDLPRPYRAWGYPITPVVFLLVTGFMMYYLLTERPLQSALGTLIMISGLVIYAVFRNRAVPGFPTASPSHK